MTPFRLWTGDGRVSNAAVPSKLVQSSISRVACPLDGKASAKQKTKENLGVMLINSEASGQLAQTLTGELIEVMSGGVASEMVET